MLFTKGSLVVITVPANKEPYHGWSGMSRHFEVGVVTARGGSTSGLYFSAAGGSTFLDTELKQINQPFIATYAALGRGIATAVFDAASLAEATFMAEKLMKDATATDYTGRTAAQLIWSAPTKSKEAIQPIFLEMVDTLPKWKALVHQIWQGRDPNR